MLVFSPFLCPNDPKAHLKERPKGPKDLIKGRSPRKLKVEDLIQSGTPKKDLRSKTEAEVKHTFHEFPNGNALFFSLFRATSSFVFL